MWAFNYKLDGIIRSYNEFKRLTHNEAVAVSEQIARATTRSARTDELKRQHELSGWFQNMLVTNAYLMMYSHLEEILAILARSPGITNVPYESSNSSNVTRFKKPFRDRHRIDITKSPQWCFIVNCAELRHLLLHANGNLSLARDPVAARTTCRAFGDDVTVKNSQVTLAATLLQRFSDAIALTSQWIAGEMEKGRE